jgi:hypothetical protein
MPPRRGNKNPSDLPANTYDITKPLPNDILDAHVERFRIDVLEMRRTPQQNHWIIGLEYNGSSLQISMDKDTNKEYLSYYKAYSNATGSGWLNIKSFNNQQPPPSGMESWYTIYCSKKLKVRDFIEVLLVRDSFVYNMNRGEGCRYWL